MSPRRQYGTGSVYQRKSDGRWFGAYEAGFNKDGTRRRRTVSADDKAEAKRKLAAKLRDIDRGNVGTDDRTTVKVWADKWLAITARVVTPNAHTTDRAAVGYIVETIGHRRLDQVSPADVRAVTTAITDDAGQSSSTALRYHGALIRMLKAAQSEGFDVPPRSLAVRGPKAAVHNRTAMTVEEALAMLKQASELEHGSRWLAAFLQGPRQAECLGLTRPNTVDGLLRLAWQLQPLSYNVVRDRTSGFRVPDGYECVQLEGRLHLVRPKSRSGWRVAPIVPLMQTALDHWATIAPDSPHDLVWPAADGRPRDENADRAEWYEMQERAGVAHPAGRPYYVHEARHTTATLLLSLGVPEPVRVQIMGHSSHASLINYEHVDLKLIKSALSKVAKQLER